jgi:1-deoxy-D-xylulose-5-phosphate synthase
VGHQAYPHKILTGPARPHPHAAPEGRPVGLHQAQRIPYDPFGAAHSSTSISAALGFAVARDLGRRAPDGCGLGDCIAVIGDGSISAGMAYEAMNNAGTSAPPLRHPQRQRDVDRPPWAPCRLSVPPLRRRALPGLPRRRQGRREPPAPAPARGRQRAKDALKHLAVGHGTLFDELGFSYVGPIDGHDMDSLLAVLRTARAAPTGRC